MEGQQEGAVAVEGVGAEDVLGTRPRLAPGGGGKGEVGTGILKGPVLYSPHLLRLSWQQHGACESIWPRSSILRLLWLINICDGPVLSCGSMLLHDPRQWASCTVQRK